MVVSLTLLLVCACSFAALHILIDTGILVKSLAMIILWYADSSSLSSLFSIISTDHSLHYGLALLHNGSSITVLLIIRSLVEVWSTEVEQDRCGYYFK